MVESRPIRATARRRAARPSGLPVEAFLEGYPASRRAIAERLRSIVHRAIPEASERVRAGWRVIGFDLPKGRRSPFFAWVFPELEHVHLGFPQGVLIADPERLLDGEGITKRARWLTYATLDDVQEDIAVRFILAAAGIGELPPDAFR
ncbi:MAG TPA: DUF1801 domain-containing protein [Candidatus Binatus sp.]|nr:DUF1801 domain-containing protein [Candidatus Binatus sp.]